MVFHEDEGEEGGRTETAVAQDEENEEVSREEEEDERRGLCVCVHSLPLVLQLLSSSPSY